LQAANYQPPPFKGRDEKRLPKQYLEVRAMIESIQEKLVNNHKLTIFTKIILGYCTISIIAVAIVGWVSLTLIRNSDKFSQFSTKSQQLATVTLLHNNIAYELIEMFAEIGELLSKATENADWEPLNKVQAKVQAIDSLVSSSISADIIDPELQDVLAKFNRYEKNATQVVSTYLSNPLSVDVTNFTRMSEDLSALKEQLGKFQSSRSAILTTELSQIAQSANQLDRHNKFLIQNCLVACAILLVLAVVISLTVSSRIVRPIKKVIDMVKDIAEGGGDLTARIEINSKDETGELAKWFNVVVEKLQVIIKDISSTTEVLNTSSSDLTSLSSQMASSAQEMTSQSETVAGTTEQMSANINTMASAAEEMSVNIESVSSAAEEMAQNMNSIASSIEEMSSSINEVANSAQEGSDITKKATEMSGSATHTMNALGNAADDIGQVTALIKRIAEQTNLLALNATIEAASAGDAGKGFAVVANEIKELAGQSSQAAEDIAQRIEGIQTNSEEAVKVIADVSDIINKINESSTVITKSVEQQTITANEISGSVQQAKTGVTNIASSIAEVARGANDTARSAAEAAKGVVQVSSNIQGVSKAAGDSSVGAQQVNTSAGELAKISTQIQEMVGRFKVAEV